MTRNLPFRLDPLSLAFLTFGLWAFLFPLAFGEGSHKPNIIQVEVLKVYPSPKVWSGIVHSVQRIDIRVLKSQVPAIGPESILEIDITLLDGSPLFDQQLRQLAKDQVSPGKKLEIKINPRCSAHLVKAAMSWSQPV